MGQSGSSISGKVRQHFDYQQRLENAAKTGTLVLADRKLTEV